MESKVLLYNSNDIKIGETSSQEAREIVSRQRAEWVDNNHTMIRFYSGMEYMENIGNTSNNNKPIESEKTYDFNRTSNTNAHEDYDDNGDYELQIHNICFARWTDGKYYPAIVSDIIGKHAKVAYLDGTTGMVTLDDAIEIYEAFETLAFQGNWQGWGYYNGVLSSIQPLVMDYDDGDVEQLHLKQLRGMKR